jgi:phospho-N-acetylmuramoyl-pentapeptide-transferase
MACFAASVCGGCLGFLLYNRHPAKLFMGDTGSMALGGALAAAAIVSGYELLLPIAGGIYVAEAVSVIIQVFVFKTQNGRRFFRMAPLHHHYELGGWEEVKVVRVFTLVTFALCLLALAGVLSVR